MVDRLPIDLTRYDRLVEEARPVKRQGRVCQVVGLTLEVQGINALLGEVCYVSTRGNGLLPAEIVGFREERVLLMPLGEMQGIQAGSPVTASGRLMTVPVGPQLLGRVLDGLGRPLDGKGPVIASERTRRCARRRTHCGAGPSPSPCLPACAPSTAC